MITNKFSLCSESFMFPVVYFPRRQIKFCLHFGALCQVHLQRLDEEYEWWEESVVFIYTGLTRANPDTVYINTTLSSHHSYSSPSLWRWTWQRVPKRRQNLIWRRGNTQKNTYKITTKVYNSQHSPDTVFTVQFPNRYNLIFESSQQLLIKWLLLLLQSLWHKACNS
jgi:hypothetical protein